MPFRSESIMRDYVDYEDLDEYEENGYYDEDGDDGEDEYAQEDEPKLTQEQLEYLELRGKLKESYRKQLKKENGSTPSKSLERSRKDNFGSFFGPSQPVIAPRVIQESKSLLENQHLVSRILNPSHSNKKVANQTAAGIRARPTSVPKVDPVKVKVQKLKDIRDYSFLLSDDAQPPAPRKEPPFRKVSAPNPESRPSQIPKKFRQTQSSGSRQVPSSSRQIPSNLRQAPGSSRQVSSGREERKHVALNGKLQHSRPGDPKANNTIRHNPISSDLKKQQASNCRKGHDRPADSSRHPLNGTKTGSERQNGSRHIPSKVDTVNAKKAVGASVQKSSMPGIQRHIPPPSWVL